MTALGDKLALGETADLGRHAFTADEIKAFAGRYDPQAFHLSEEAAARSIFGRLCASGWHTTAVWSRLNAEADRALNRRLRDGEQTPVVFAAPARLGPLRWLAPVYAGETIAFVRRFTALNADPGRPGWWLAGTHGEAFNVDGAQVMAFEGTVPVRDGPT